MNTCPLCGQAPNYIERGTHAEGGVTYTLKECQACGAQIWFPFKNLGSEWYEHDTRYLGANSEPPLAPNFNHTRTVAYFKEKTGRVLDIGCGTGNFLAHARTEGWEAHGIDFDRNAVASAKSNFGLTNVEVASIEEYCAHNTLSFDLVTFFDVFEHLDNHNEFTALVRSLLVPNGYIALSVPYGRGSRWLQKHDLPPRHLTRWNEDSLPTFLKRSGFKVVLVSVDPVSIGMMAIKLRLRYGRFVSFGLVRRVRSLFGRKQKTIQTKQNETVPVVEESGAVRAAGALAKIKDLIIFGLPALIVWLVLGRKGRSTGLFVIAQKID